MRGMSSASWLCKGLTGDEAQLNPLCSSAPLARHAFGLTFNKHFKRSIIFQLHRFASSFRTQSKSARQNDNETVDNMNETRAGARAEGAGKGGGEGRRRGCSVSWHCLSAQCRVCLNFARDPKKMRWRKETLLAGSYLTAILLSCRLNVAAICRPPSATHTPIHTHT